MKAITTLVLAILCIVATCARGRKCLIDIDEDFYNSEVKGSPCTSFRQVTTPA